MSTRQHHHRRRCACSICRAGDYVAPHRIIGRAIAANGLYARLWTRLLAGQITCRRERRTLFRLHRQLTGVPLMSTLKLIAHRCSDEHIRVRVRM